MLLERDVKLRVVAAVLFEGRAEALVPPRQSRAGVAGAETPAAPTEEPKPTEPATEPAVAKPAEPVVAAPATPGNSTPPAPMRPKPAAVRETRATARRRR